MNRSRRVAGIAAVFIYGTVVALGQNTASCTYTVFQFPGATATIASGINDYNTVVGAASVDGYLAGFIRWSNGTFTKVKAPGADNTLLRNRNDKGVSVGFYTAGNATRGLRLMSGTYQTVDYPGQSFTLLLGINNYGSSVGYVDTPDAQYGFKRWSNGRFTSKIQYPNSSATIATGINDSGVVVGTVNADAGPGSMFGFALIHGKYQQINDPAASRLSTFVSDINNNQIIVGTSYNFGPPVTSHAFRVINGTVERLPLPSGASDAEASGINRGGIIVGDAQFSGVQKAYIAHCH